MGPKGAVQMTMGLKIHRMIKEDGADDPELREEAKKRKEVSDNILEIIYNRIMNKGKTRYDGQDEEEDDDLTD